MAKNKNKQRSGSTAAVAEPETETNEDETPTVEATADAGGRRLPHVEPTQFAALRDELKMSNKQVAEAIGRTLARVSELTYSQGASIQTWERFEKDVRAWREEHPATSDDQEGNETPAEA